MHVYEVCYKEFVFLRCQVTLGCGVSVIGIALENAVAMHHTHEICFGNHFIGYKLRTYVKTLHSF